MSTIPLLLQMAALVCFACAFLGIMGPTRLGWLGLLLWALSFMIGPISLHSASRP